MKDSCLKICKEFSILNGKAKQNLQQYNQNTIKRYEQYFKEVDTQMINKKIRRGSTSLVIIEM